MKNAAPIFVRDFNDLINVCIIYSGRDSVYIFSYFSRQPTSVCVCEIRPWNVFVILRCSVNV